MPDLHIRIKRHADSSASITLTRADGSVTWQRQRGQIGHVFPPHDITHYAVETSLGYRQGFFGLVADGWEIADFAAPWPRGPIPREAMEVELIVGFFDAERRSAGQWSTQQFNEHAVKYVSSSKHAATLTPPVLGDHDISRIRLARQEILERWFATCAGNALELTFDRASTPPASASTAPRPDQR